MGRNENARKVMYANPDSKLAICRMEKKMTQKEPSQILDISVPLLYLLESKKKPIETLSLEKISILVDALECDLESLIDDKKVLKTLKKAIK